MIKPNICLVIGVCLTMLTGVSDGGTAAFGADASAGKIVLIAGDLSDPFFGAIKRGADDAAKDLGVEYTYLPAGINAADLAKAIQAAGASAPAGVAFGDWFPDTEDRLVKALAEKGVPIVGFNSGPDNWQESTGAIAWVNQSDFAAGELAGSSLAAAGAKRALCVNHGPGATLFEQRCRGLQHGMEANAGASTVINIPWSDASNPAKVTQAVQAALQNDSKIDAIFTLGSGVARDAVTAVKKSGRDVTVGTVDLSTAVLNQVANGELLFAIDQQPYLQGYYAIAILAQEKTYGLHLVGQVSTGPVAITKKNAGRVIEINGANHGIRGAL